MSRTVTAQPGDTLCGIAADNGFPDCTILRALPANSRLLNRPLRGGDVVTVPDIVPGDVPGLGTGALHEFLVAGHRGRIRFVHGSPDLPVADDHSLTHLNVSNYVTHRAGVPESAAFPDHSTSAFNAAADQDVDAFKVEVFDPDRSSASADIELLALKPQLNAAFDVTGYEEFSGSDRSARSLTATCRRTSSDRTRYRSCYLRVVTDQEDKSSRSRQTLLVTDMADGNAGANDHVEILDQRVRATYVIEACPQSGDAKCRSVAEVFVGENRKRFRLQVHVLRSSPGGAALVAGLTLQEARRHIRKWVTRTYAAANMGVRLVDDLIEAIDPLENLISVFNEGRRLTVGGRRISVEVNAAAGPVAVSHTTARDETPRQIADALATQISAVPGFAAQVFDNPVSFNHALSADILVTRTDGARVVLTNATSADTRTRIGVGRVNPAVSIVPEVNFLAVGARDHRVMMRNFALRDDCLHIFVINRFRATDQAVGLAYPRFRQDPPEMQARRPIFCSVLVDAHTMKSNDRECHTADHECGHVLLDMLHFDGRHPELMTNEPVDPVNSVNASKRLTDRVLPYNDFRFSTSTNISRPLNPVTEARTAVSEVIEDWPRTFDPDAPSATGSAT